MAHHLLALRSNYIDKTKINKYDGNAFERDTAATDPLIDEMTNKELQWQNT